MMDIIFGGFLLVKYIYIKKKEKRREKKKERECKYI